VRPHRRAVSDRRLRSSPPPSLVTVVPLALSTALPVYPPLNSSILTDAVPHRQTLTLISTRLLGTVVTAHTTLDLCHHRHCRWAGPQLGQIESTRRRSSDRSIEFPHKNVRLKILKISFQISRPIMGRPSDVDHKSTR
jgi:hypothetical protein